MGRSGGGAGGGQSARRKVAQNHPYRQQRALIPRLRHRRFFLILLSLLVRGQRRGEISERHRRGVTGRPLQPFAGQAERNKVDKGALATPRLAQQHQAAMAVEFGHGGERATFTVSGTLTMARRVDQFRQIAFTLLGEQRGVDRIELQRWPPLVTHPAVDPQQVDRPHLAIKLGEISQAQASWVSAVGIGNDLVEGFDIGLGPDVAAVIAGGDLAVGDGLGGHAAVAGADLLGLPAGDRSLVGFLSKDTGGVELINLGFVNTWFIGHRGARLLELVCIY